jgi:hypothetical protein
MEQNENEGESKRKQHLRVPVSKKEKAAIEANAKQAGISVAKYLREVGMGYEIKGIMDYQAVRELIRVNADLGRLGGLLKMWLSDDKRVAEFTPFTIEVLLKKIEETREEMQNIVKNVVKTGKSKIKQ